MLTNFKFAALIAAIGLWACSAQAQTYQLTAYARTTVIDGSVAHEDNNNFNFLNKPEAFDFHSLNQTTPGTLGTSTAKFLGTIGSLKAFTSASYASTIGTTSPYGYSNSTVQGQFYDTVNVFGAGLAAGSPVSYRVDFSISGDLSSPNSETGGHLSADGLAKVFLRDLTTSQEVAVNWDAKKDATGLYSLILTTAVGHDLGIFGMLYSGASVDSFALTGRSATSDFYHSANYSLTPSIAGLNTTGASGHNFLAPVPEPEAWAMLLAGLALMTRMTRARRQKSMEY